MLIKLNFIKNNTKRSVSKIFVLLVFFVNLTLVSCSSKKNDPYLNLTAQEIYNKGKENIHRNKFKQAIADLEALESNYPYGYYADRAKLALIYAYYGKEDFLQAKEAANRFIKMYPSHKHIDYVYYMQGLANYYQYYSTIYKLFNLDRSKRETTFAMQSFDIFKLLLERYPNSKYSPDAYKRMLHLRNELAFHELDLANYYFMKGAYLAAVNRCKFIISNFDQSKAIKDALKLMIRSYKILNMPELEQYAIKLLNINFNNNSDT